MPVARLCQALVCMPGSVEQGEVLGCDAGPGARNERLAVLVPLQHRVPLLRAPNLICLTCIPAGLVGAGLVDCITAGFQGFNTAGRALRKVQASLSAGWQRASGQARHHPHLNRPTVVSRPKQTP